MGFADDIIAIRQVDNLTVIQLATVDIVIQKAIDQITIRDIENVLSGSSQAPDSIIVQQQADDIVVIKQRADDLSNR